MSDFSRAVAQNAGPALEALTRQLRSVLYQFSNQLPMLRTVAVVFDWSENLNDAEEMPQMLITDSDSRSLPELELEQLIGLLEQSAKLSAVANERVQSKIVATRITTAMEKRRCPKNPENDVTSSKLPSKTAEHELNPQKGWPSD